MARMSIDDRFLRDPRVTQMAIAMGWSKYEARGRLMDVFAIVYDRVNAGRVPLLSASDIDTAAEFVGLTARMIEFDLAVNTDRGVHVRGSKEYTNYLNTRSPSGRAGGIKSGEIRREKARTKSKVTFDENEGRLNPSASASASASDLEKEERPAAPPFALEALKAKVDKATSPHQAVIAEFTARYEAAYNASPSWTKWSAQVKALLKQHSPDEIKRRIAILFTSPPSWLHGPYDFGTLVQHFDKLVGAPSKPAVKHQQIPSRLAGVTT